MNRTSGFMMPAALLLWEKMLSNDPPDSWIDIVSPISDAGVSASEKCFIKKKCTPRVSKMEYLFHVERFWNKNVKILSLDPFIQPGKS
jgi:hypothetical protein